MSALQYGWRQKHRSSELMGEHFRNLGVREAPYEDVMLTFVTVPRRVLFYFAYAVKCGNAIECPAEAAVGHYHFDGKWKLLHAGFSQVEGPLRGDCSDPSESRMVLDVGDEGTPRLGSLAAPWQRARVGDVLEITFRLIADHTFVETRKACEGGGNNHWQSWRRRWPATQFLNSPAPGIDQLPPESRMPRFGGN